MIENTLENTLEKPHKTSDKILLLNTKKVRAKEKAATEVVLKHLAEVYRRRLWCDLKYQSMNQYCRTELGYSADEAQLRIDAARVLIDIPDAATHTPLTTLAYCHRHFRREGIKKPAEKKKILKQVKGKTIQKAAQTLFAMATIKPQPKDEARFLDKDKVQMTITISRRDFAQFQKFRGRLIHKNGPINHSFAFAKLLEILPKKGRAVLNGCSNCGSNYALEVDHIHPKGKGGSNKPDNLRILCRACNQREAIKAYSICHMQKFLH